MISYQQAIEIICHAAFSLPAESLPCTEANGRILAADLIAPHDMPPFDQSLMDGYALRSADTRAATEAQPVRLSLGRTLTAGESLCQPAPPRQAMRIMTGASMPEGLDTVIKLEESEVEAETLIVRQALPRGQYVQRRGAEIRRHTVVMQAGVRLTPQRLGIALSLGTGCVEVIRRPRVAFIAPGDELLLPGAPPQPGKKWCSNLYALDLRAQELACTSVNLGIVPDTLDDLVVRIRQGLASDVVVILGASGRGDHDFAVRALGEIGAEILFRGVATSPGRSITVARHDQTLIFGLPGSPWATFVGFETFVWPALRVMMRQKPALPRMAEARLTHTVRVRRGVTHFLPARLQWHSDGWQATPLSNFLALARVDSQSLGLIVVPPHRRQFLQGTRVGVQLLAF